MMKAASSLVTGAKNRSHPLNGKWARIPSLPLPRSSHTISVVSGRAYIFGGEIQPREPVDNDMHVIILPSGTVGEADCFKIPARALSPNTSVADGGGATVPQKRIGHTAAVIGDRIFMFGGRGGKDLAALEEYGRVWVFDTRTSTWSFIDPLPGTPYPPARSYHASVAIDRPKPSSISSSLSRKTGDMAPADLHAGMVTADAQAREEGFGTLFIHAGCLSKGRTNDLWGFDVMSKTWKVFPSAPGEPRGGTALTIAKNRIYRYGGFNGESEEGGQVDFLELAVDTFEDLSGEGPGEVALTAKGEKWKSWVYRADADIVESGEDGVSEAPGPRSVAGLHAITTGMGREYLILLLGERTPSSIGHEGAGRFWRDVWSFQVPPIGMTAASVRDATWQALGRETGEWKWSRIHVADAEAEEVDGRAANPGERGWFASASAGELDPGAIILWGGVNGDNEREGDGWILNIE